MNLAENENVVRRARSRRLLESLSEAGAFARFDDGEALVYAPRRGITVRICAARVEDLKQLISEGAVEEQSNAGGTKRSPQYRLAEAGVARIKRDTSPLAEQFAMQHSERIIVPGTAAMPAHAMNTQESPLLWLYRRKGKTAGGIGEAEFAAGERLRADMTMARTLPNLSPDWERPSRSGIAMGLTPSEARMAAGQRVQNALKAVGPELSGILVDVCGFLKGIELIERERGWPARSAKLVLVLALAALGRHYGLSNAAVGPQRAARTVSWTATGAKPEFSTSADVSVSPAALQI